MSHHPDRDVPCPFAVRLPVLGVTTTFLTNAREVQDLVERVYGAWAELDDVPGLVSPSDATVRIVVDGPAGRAAAASASAAEGAADPYPSFRHRVIDVRYLRVEAPGGEGSADALLGRSIARVDAALVATGAPFVEGMLEPLTLFLLGALDRQPVHASAVVRDGTAILLAGPSGAGKSTLAHAARQAGFAPLADEPVYVQLDPRLRVWGRRSRLHLAAEARAHFPGLHEVEPVRLATGKTKVVVPGGAGDPRWAERAGICVLRRGGAERTELRRMTPAEVVIELTERLDPGFDVYTDTIGERIARIAERGAWSLHWSGGPEGALPLLDRVAAALEREG
jgi:hypothetical protein